MADMEKVYNDLILLTCIVRFLSKNKDIQRELCLYFEITISTGQAIRKSNGLWLEIMVKL